MNKKILLTSLTLIIQLFIFSSCNFLQKEQIRVRACATSKNGSELQFTVYPENSSGNIINGAIIIVRDETNIVTHLTFDNSSQSYIGSVPNNENSEMKFFVEVDSILSNEIITIEIPHLKLTSKPILTDFSDSEGNSVLSAETLNSDKDILIAWESLGENIVYTVSINTSANTIWTKSTNANSVSIPAKTLNNGIYFLKISAQKIYGDPLFRDTNYYSVSEISGSNFSFSTK